MATGYSSQPVCLSVTHESAHLAAIVADFDSKASLSNKS